MAKEYILECDKCGNKFDLHYEGVHNESGNSLCSFCEENESIWIEKEENNNE